MDQEQEEVIWSKPSIWKLNVSGRKHQGMDQEQEEVIWNKPSI
jgi:hypothetical protein